MGAFEWWDDQGTGTQVAVILGGSVVSTGIVLGAAALIGAFVLGMGSAAPTAPQASFDWSYDASSDTMTIEHEGGNEIRTADVAIRVDGERQSFPGSAETFTAGDSITVEGVPDDADVEIVWVGADSEVVIAVHTAES